MAKKKTSRLDVAQIAIKQIEEKFGEGSIMRLKDADSMVVETIPTGCLSLDIALGAGGVPRGRIIEVYGPEMSGKTTLALHIIAEAQKLGGIAAFVDAEHSLSPKYSELIGVKTGDLLISQPNSGEEALGIVETLVRSNNISVIVVDSVAALVPQKEIEGEMGDHHVALQARLMSQALRKLAPIVAKSNTVVIFINQIRIKVGVFFGCIHSETRIPTKLGMLKMKDVKKGTEILSLNKKNTFDYKKVQQHFYNGTAMSEEFTHLTTRSFDSRAGRYGVILTKNHKVLTKQGWVEAGKLESGALIAAPIQRKISGSLRQFLLGTCSGDTSIYIRGHSTGGLKIQDTKNKQYVEWKLEKLKSFFKFRKNEVRHDSNYSSELALFKNNEMGGTRNPLHFLEKEFSWLGLALWFMDDVHFDNKDSHCRYVLSIKRYKTNKNILNRVKKAFEEQNLFPTVNYKNGSLSFNKKDTLFIANKIKRFIPKSMQYKLPKRYQGKYKEFKLEGGNSLCLDYVELLSNKSISKRAEKSLAKHDLSVLPNENYVVGGKNGGIVVHNSPETTSGGMALKFYSSVRIELRRSAQIKKGDKVVGNRVKTKVVKNKVAPPFTACQFDIMYDEGISLSGDLIDIGIEKDVIKKSGNSYSFGEYKLGVGREKAKATLVEDKKMSEQIKKEIWAKLKNKQ